MAGKIIAYLFFGIFAFGGLAAFIGSSFEPISYYLTYGRWQEPPTQILIGCIFLLTHGGIGFGGLIYLWKSAKKETNFHASPHKADKPWLSKEEWASSTIESNLKTSAPIVRGIAKYFIGVSIIAVLAIIECIRLGEYNALYGLLMPLIAYLLYFWANRLEGRLKKYGLMPLMLDPYPGSIGGQLGGTIQIKHINQLIRSYSVEIHCIYHYKSGKDSRSNTVWNEKLVPMWQNTAAGHTLSFCFDLPDDLPQSEDDAKYPYHEWCLDVHIELENGKDIERKYSDLPVFKTNQASSIKNKQASADSSATQTMHKQAVEQLMRFTQNSDGSYFKYFPAMRNSWQWIFVGIGLIFIIIGVLIPERIFNIVFPLLGGAAFLGGIYALACSFDLTINPIEIRTQEYLFGRAGKETILKTYEIKDITTEKSHSTTVNNKTTQYYNVVAKGKNKEKIILVENIEGMGQAKVAIAEINQLMGR